MRTFNKGDVYSVIVHYENTPMKYTAIFQGCKTDKFQMKKCDIFSYFCSKHRSWVHVRTASLLEPPQSMFWNKNKQIMYTPVNPSFTIQKWGVRGIRYTVLLFAMFLGKKSSRYSVILVFQTFERNYIFIQ